MFKLRKLKQFNFLQSNFLEWLDSTSYKVYVNYNNYKIIIFYKYSILVVASSVNINIYMTAEIVAKALISSWIPRVPPTSNRINTRYR